MKKKIIQIGGNLRINGISSFIMTLYRNMYKDYQFIFINTAEGKDHYRQEITELGGKVYDVAVKGKGLLRSLRQAKEIRKILKKRNPLRFILTTIPTTASICIRHIKKGFLLGSLIVINPIRAV